MNISEDVLIYDIETRVFGKPDPEKDKLRLFGCYSYKTGKPYLTSDREMIQLLINKHRYLVGFNTKYYDNPILQKFGIDLKYKTIIDLREVVDKRCAIIKIDKGLLSDLLIEKSLKYITELLGIVDTNTGKMKIDYSMFKKDTLTNEEYQLLQDYTKRDIEVTKKLYEWLENYFDVFKYFVIEKDVQNKSYLTAAPATFAYKALCKEMNWEVLYNEIEEGSEDHEAILGGYVSYPAGERFEGNIYCLDFQCLPENTKISMWRDCKQFYKKNIQDIKKGDMIVNQDGKQIILETNKQYYNGDLLEFELQNGKKISCTPEHKFPIIRNKKEIVIEAKDILQTDEFILRHTKRGIKNGHYSGGKKLCICEICGKEFYQYLSGKGKGCGNKQCANILKSIHSKKPNKGKNKFNTDWMMKLSLKRKGILRSREVKDKIKNTLLNYYKQPGIIEKHREINKNRDMTFMKDINWKTKVLLSRKQNINNGKFEYKGIKFRSNWEIIIAKNLDKNNIKWQYEPKIFNLGDGDAYAPDFYLPELDKWLEIKGFMYDHSRKKIQKFIQQQPNFLLLNDLQQIKDEDIKWLK